MPDLTIHISEQLQEFLEQQVASGSAPSAGDYVRELLTEEVKRKAVRSVDWEDIRRAVGERRAG